MVFFGSVVDNSIFSLSDGFLGISWEKNEFAEIVGESVFIEFQGFLSSVLSSVVDGNADGPGKLNTQTCSFNFAQRES